MKTGWVYAGSCSSHVSALDRPACANLTNNWGVAALISGIEKTSRSVAVQQYMNMSDLTSNSTRSRKHGGEQVGQQSCCRADDFNLIVFRCPGVTEGHVKMEYMTSYGVCVPSPPACVV